MDSTDNSHYCRLPWTGFANDPSGLARPCCYFTGAITDDEGRPMYLQEHSPKEVLTSTFMKRLRQDFRENKKNPGCATCWKDEAVGKRSKRQIYWSDLDYDAEPEHATEYQLIISNTCNLKCRTCSPSHSTKWIKEALDLKRLDAKPTRSQVADETSVMWQARRDWMPHITNLDIVGGEPFFIKEWEILWREFADIGQSKNIMLGISSNATIYNAQLVQFLIDNFKRTGIGLSIDGIGAQFEYLRHPGKWDETKANIDAYYQLHTDPANKDRYGNSMTHTVSWMNIWYLPDFHEYTSTHWPDIPIWNTVVYGPKHFSPWALPEPVREKVRERLSTCAFPDIYMADIQGIMKIMDEPFDPSNWDMAKYTVKQSDAYRSEQFATSFPEFFEILAPYWD